MRVVWLRRAIADLQAVHDFIANDNPPAALATTSKIATAVTLLTDQPSLGRAGRVPRTRELVIPDTPYVVPYAMIANEIRILAVLHGARRWPTSFERQE